MYDLISSGKISDPRLLLQQEREAEEKIPELEELSERQLRSMSQNQRAEYLQQLSEQRSKSRSEGRIQGEEEKTQI